MPKPTKGPRLGGGPAHERLMLANLATSLFEHGRITTTVAKARRLRPVAERLITKAKKGDLHNRRQVMRSIRDKSVVHTLFTEIGPQYAERPGGYTRIIKLGPRRGDNAPMAVIELVEAMTVHEEAVGEAEAATRRAVKEGGEPEPDMTSDEAEAFLNEDPWSDSTTSGKPGTKAKAKPEAKAEDDEAAEWEEEAWEEEEDEEPEGGTSETEAEAKDDTAEAEKPTDQKPTDKDD